MSVFYVRPQREGGYGSGDGTSYENAWNGFDAIDWTVVTAERATLVVCGLRGLGAPAELRVEVQRLAPMLEP